MLGDSPDETLALVFDILLQIGSNWYMDTGVRDLEVAFFQANILPDLMT